MKRSFGALPGVLLGVGSLAILGLVPVRLFVVPSFLAMFEDFGGDLPWSTRLVASSGFWWVTALASATLLALGTVIRLRRGSAAGTALLAAATVVVAGAIVFAVWALYAPIFDLAGNVGAE